MILWVFIEFFRVKIIITDILPICYRYFFRNSNTCMREIKVRRFFFPKIRPKNRRKIYDFFILSSIFSAKTHL